MSFDPAWEAAHAARAWGRWPNEHLVRFVSRNYEVPSQFLDLGCGAGAQAAFLVAEGHTVTAVDGSETALERAMDRVGREFSWGAAGAAIWANEDVTAYRKHRAAFDCIVDVATLQHLDNIGAAAVVGRALDWLKPGGRFFSLHASPMADEAIVSRDGTVRVRRAGRSEILGLFHAYRVELGHEIIDRPQGGRVAHWIIEAQKP